MNSQGYKDLIVYKKAYAAAMEIFNLPESKYKLIIEEYIQVGKMLGSMMSTPEKFTVSKLPTATANFKTE